MANSPVDNGSLAADAIHLSGEMFRCADDVVVSTRDLGDLVAAAQLAAALEGPLLLPHPDLATEVERLTPLVVHIVGEPDVEFPESAEVVQYTSQTATLRAARVLDVGERFVLSGPVDAQAISRVLQAIRDRGAVVMPSVGTSTSGADRSGQPDPTELIEGLAVPSQAERVWMVPAASPAHALVAAAFGSSVDAAVVAVAANDLLAHPIVSEAIGGGPKDIRFIGTAPDLDPWHLQVLRNGVQVPGGGFSILPDRTHRRYVAFYGHPETSALGVLGEQGPEETLARMEPFLIDYARDGAQVVPVFEMIASVAAAGETGDADYSYEWPIETFQPWIDAAAANDAYVILDLQPGRDDFLTQAKQYEDLLKLPFVGLALDPEWRLGPDQVHLEQVGRVSAAEVNRVIHWLANLVRDEGLPQKMLIVHQFRTFMIQDRAVLEQRPELQLVIQMDGDGTEAQKDNTYAALNVGAENAFWAWGWKNFFDEDEPGPPSPESTMAKDPVPVYVSYQ